jgi:hypothetical protein
MKNISFFIEDELLQAGQKYARMHNMSFNGLVRRLLEQAVRPQNKRHLSPDGSGPGRFRWSKMDQRCVVSRLKIFPAKKMMQPMRHWEPHPIQSPEGLTACLLKSGLMFYL